MIVCTGPESSGTRLLERIVATSGVACGHRSMPHANDWNLGLTSLDEVVVITRERMATARSAVATGHAPSLERALMRRDLALGLITEQVLQAGVASLWIDYDALTLRPEVVVEELADFIGARVTIPEAVRRATRPRES